MRQSLIQAIHIKLKPSYLLMGLLLAVSVACSMVLVTLPISVYVQIMAITAIIISSLYFIFRDALLWFSWSWQTIEVTNDSKLIVTNKRGDIFQPTLSSTTLVHPKMTILNFKHSGYSFALPPILMFTNTENQNALRLLRTWLLWGNTQ
jgi:hypothetical protein